MENLTQAVRDLDEHVADLRVDIRRRSLRIAVWTGIVAAALLVAVVVGTVAIQGNRHTNHVTASAQARTADALERVRQALVASCQGRQQRDAVDIAKDRALRDAEAAAIPGASPGVAKLLQRQVDAYDAELAYLAKHPNANCALRFGG